MADIIDFEKAKGEKEETIDVYQCQCGSYFWIKTSEGDICGFCEAEFELGIEEEE